MSKIASTIALLLTAVSTSNAVAQWVKRTVPDQMTGKPSHVSYSVVSSNELQLPFPYEGRTTGLLGLRIGRIEGGIQVGLMMERGQFVCPPNDCSVRIRLDDGEPFSLRAAPSRDGRPNLIMLQDQAGKLLAGTRQAQKIMVEATILEVGEKVFIFSTPGGTAAATVEANQPAAN